MSETLMPQSMKQKRGLKANLPALLDGELALCTDTKELFIGYNGENYPVDALQSEIVYLSKFKSDFVGQDISPGLLNALAQVKDGGMIVFDVGDGYKVTQQFTIDKPVTIDFNNDELLIEVDSTRVFDLRLAGGHYEQKGRINLINYNFKKVDTYIPISMIYVNGAINSTLQGTMSGVECSHSLIHNYKGYGTHIRGEYRYTTSPRVIYLSNSSGDIHSFAFNIDVDITGNSGIGIETEGANGTIKGVIENCAGGYFYNGVHVATGINIMAHFELNTLYDVKIGRNTRDAGTANTGTHVLIGCLFVRSVDDQLLFGNDQKITLIGCALGPRGVKPIPGILSLSSTNITAIASQGGLDVATYPGASYNLIGTYSSQFKDLLAKGLTATGAVKFDVAEPIKFVYNGETKMELTEIDLRSPGHRINLGNPYARFPIVYTETVNVRSPNGTQWNITVSDSGTLSASQA